MRYTNTVETSVFVYNIFYFKSRVVLWYNSIGYDNTDMSFSIAQIVYYE